VGSYRGGWVLTETTGGMLVRRASATVAIVSALLVGTGGLMTADYFAKRHDRGYKFYQVTSAHVLAGPVQRTPEENLAFVCEVFRPPISELASMFGVSRQAVYDWRKGARPLPEHANLLKDVARAADVFVAEGLAPAPRTLGRLVPGGRSLIDIVREGGSIEDTARALAAVLRRERDQRARFQARLGTRSRQPLEVETIGVPMLDERA
jgi:transcriptional regulator with XRE-family HTH domain